jgi:hypothetical protein
MLIFLYQTTRPNKPELSRQIVRFVTPVKRAVPAQQQLPFSFPAMNGLKPAALPNSWKDLSVGRRVLSCRSAAYPPWRRPSHGSQPSGARLSPPPVCILRPPDRRMQNERRLPKSRQSPNSSLLERLRRNQESCYPVAGPGATQAKLLAQKRIYSAE